MKEVFEELERMGFFKEYRPFSIMLFAEQIRKKTKASLEVDSKFNVKLQSKKWMLSFGPNGFTSSGSFSDADYERIAEGIAIAKSIIYSQIATEVLSYPREPQIIWATYNEARLFGFKKLKIKEVAPSDSKASFDFPGKYKLGAMFIGGYKGNFDYDLDKLISEISDFFLNYGKYAYGTIFGDVEKFKILTLALAKKGDFIARRVYIALANATPIKITDFEYLNNKFKLKVKFVHN